MPSAAAPEPKRPMIADSIWNASQGLILAVTVCRATEIAFRRPASSVCPSSGRPCFKNTPSTSLMADSKDSRWAWLTCWACHVRICRISACSLQVFIRSMESSMLPSATFPPARRDRQKSSQAPLARLDCEGGLTVAGRRGDAHVVMDLDGAEPSSECAENSSSSPSLQRIFTKGSPLAARRSGLLLRSKARAAALRRSNSAERRSLESFAAFLSSSTAASADWATCPRHSSPADGSIVRTSSRTCSMRRLALQGFASAPSQARTSSSFGPLDSLGLFLTWPSQSSRF
mmetsp:Transcript_82770/g.146175  ORF Transcript_82770/g.146175 Transcript_82770/m.146175 type:complete len:288 (-) Transcript_82770:825-1688(-)